MAENLNAPNGTVGTHVVNSTASTTAQSINRSTVSEKIARIGWSNAPLDTMLRNIPKGKTNSDTYEFFSVAARGVECTVGTEATVTGAKMTITLSSGVDCLSKSGILLVPSIEVKNKVAQPALAKGVAKKPLMLHICKVNYGDKQVVCMPINASSANGTVKIAANAKMYRAGIACDQDTAITDDPQAMPVKDRNFCQRMLCTISENAYQALQDKEAEFGLADLKEQAIFDFRLQGEASAIFGGMAALEDNFVDPESMKRKLHMRGVLDFDIQEIDGDSSVDVDEFLNNDMQSLFSVNNGSEERLLLYGAGFATKLANSKWWTKQLEANKTEMKWGVTWKMVESNFGRLRGIMDPALSLMGYENSALVIDPRHIRVVEQVPMQERALDLQKAGIRNSHDVVLEESITLELTNPKAHGILTLA